MFGLKKLRFGTLGVIASLLLFSAATRLLGVSSAAFALDSQNAQAETQRPSSENTEKSANLDKLLESFKAREATLEQEEARLKERFEKLASAERSIKVKMDALVASEARLRELLTIADVAAEDDVARLTSVYENMKPKAAATVFEEMPPAFAAGFLSRMGPAAAASVMANLAPQTAYAISVVFAGRNAEQPSK